MSDQESPSAASAASAPDRKPNTRIFARFQPWAEISLEILIVLACVSVVFFRRLIELEEVEVGGDALTVWEFARNLVLGGDFPARLNHHTTRFGLVLPTMVVQWLFGSQATSYFIGPLIASVLLHLWIYLIVRKLSGPVGAVLSVLCLLGFSPMVRASSQILPEAYGPMYAAFATYAALLFTDASTMRGRWLALTATGVGIIFAYGAKEVYLFYAPGVALLVWFGGTKGPLLPERWSHAPPPGLGEGRLRRFAHALRTSQLVVPAALTSVVLLLVLVETIFLIGVADAGSRLDVVSSSHGGGGAGGPRISEVQDFFALYTKAPAEWVQALTAAVIALIGVAAFARDRRSGLVGLTLFIFFLLQTFIVRRLDPLTPWFEPHPRYLLGMVGPIAMVLGIFVGDALKAILERLPGASSASRWTSLVVSLLLFLLAGRTLPRDFDATWGKRDAWTRTEAKQKDFTAAYLAGIPIVADTPLGKPAVAAASLFIHPDALRDKEGKLVKTSDIIRTMGKNGRFVARAALSPEIRRGRLRNVVEERARKRRCAVVLRQAVRFITGNPKFEKGCVSLEDEFAADPKAGALSRSGSRKMRTRHPSKHPRERR